MTQAPSEPEPRAAAADGGTAAFLNRELALLILLAAAGVATFLATRALAVSNASLRARDAATWHATGREALAAGHLAQAVTALRRAARIDRNDRDIAFALASALQASGDQPEAVEVLEVLRDRHPDDPDVNLELARLEAASDNVPLAIRYYEDALGSLWSPDVAERNRAIRLEFISLLLAKGQRGRALSQVLLLAADLPADRSWRLRAGRLFLAAGDPTRALTRAAAILEADDGDQDAMTLAGEASFQLGDYARARRWLSRVRTPEPRVAALLDVAGLVISTDPLAPRLATAERRRRAGILLDRATTRLEACGPLTPDRATLAESVRAAAEAVAPAGRRSGTEVRDQAEEAIGLALRAERLASSCPNPTPLDRAIPLIAKIRQIEELP